MANWGLSKGNAANSVTWATLNVSKAETAGNQTALFGNTTVGATGAGRVVSQIGVSAVDAANTSADTKKAVHAGWNLKTSGSGSLVTLTITTPGTGYSNTDTVRVTGVSPGSVNATATLGTNATGAITSLTITNTGSGFILTAPTVVVANSTGGVSAGAGAVIVSRAGGRAGRTNYETLVAMGTLT